LIDRLNEQKDLRREAQGGEMAPGQHSEKKRKCTQQMAALEATQRGGEDWGKKIKGNTLLRPRSKLREGGKRKQSESRKSEKSTVRPDCRSRTKRIGGGMGKEII